MFTGLLDTAATSIRHIFLSCKKYLYTECLFILHPQAKAFQQEPSFVSLGVLHWSKIIAASQSSCEVYEGSDNLESHYGHVVCNKCYQFFCRATNGDKAEKYQCKNQNKCDITKEEGKRYNTICQQCRYQKCLAIGMKRKQNNSLNKEATSPSRAESSEELNFVQCSVTAQDLQNSCRQSDITNVPSPSQVAKLQDSQLKEPHPGSFYDPQHQHTREPDHLNGQPSDTPQPHHAPPPQQTNPGIQTNMPLPSVPPPQPHLSHAPIVARHSRISRLWDNLRRILFRNWPAPSHCQHGPTHSNMLCGAYGLYAVNIW